MPSPKIQGRVWLPVGGQEGALKNTDPQDPVRHSLPKTEVGSRPQVRVKKRALRDTLQLPNLHPKHRVMLKEFKVGGLLKVTTATI